MLFRSIVLALVITALAMLMSNAAVLPVIAALVAAAILALGGAAWYAMRRLLRRKAVGRLERFLRQAQG